MLLSRLLDKRFIYDTHACRKGYGVHLAVKRYQKWSKTHTYALKLDVSRYFPSIDHLILKQQLSRRIKDKKILCLFNTIIANVPVFPKSDLRYFSGDDLFTPLERVTGLPIGNLTSQILANLYLDDLDHFIKHKLRVKHYIRYVDDFILLSRSKEELHQWCAAIEDKLFEVRLRLHPKKVNIFQTRLGVDVLGYHVFPDYKKLRNDNGYRFVRRLRYFSQAYHHNILNWYDFNSSVQSWIGHAKQADTLGLRQMIFDSTVFTRERS